MDFVGEDVGGQSGVVVHDRANAIWRCVENVEAGQVIVVGGRQHDGEHAVLAQGEVASAMFPDDGVGVGPDELAGGAQEHHCVAACRSQPLVHHLVGDGR
jgi:hypothetical protein